jgi:hypothetical protein
MRFMMTLLGTICAVTLLACGGDDKVDPLDAPVGAIGPEAELAYDGTVYKPVEAVPRDEVSDDALEQIDTAEKISVPYTGEIPVYVRDGEEDAVYTPDITTDPDGSVGETWIRWLPHDQVEAPDDENDYIPPVERSDDDTEPGGGGGNIE